MESPDINNILISNFSARAQGILDTITGIIALIITALITWQLFRVALAQIPNQDTTQNWELSLWPFGLVMALASILMSTALILHIFVNIRVATGLGNNPTEKAKE